ncbi:rhamnulokinase [Clostridium sp. PL3]|uniref:Rhamnulokinase n=1 Tax=Clostridium thailandense TaxID=2794346 RepID=A0A949X4G7_9CLOT|nr:FGGY-family carbohydrate kinase [Clostridium thailandense]MBV7273963.1 rhamnulokinase [Clostridium thailandense]
MKKEKRVLAFDFGASGGRAMLGIYDGSNIKIEEIHRFSNDPVIVNGTMYWDILRLFYEIKQGLIKAKFHGGFDSVGIDTWGVDFGIIDECGDLVENPIHYRDGRTKGMLEKSFEKISKDEFYYITGNQFMEINTAFQLLSLVEKRSYLLEKADKILLMPDLLNYMLTGIKTTEYSIASTTQLLDAKKGMWSDKAIEALNIPKKLFTEIIPTGTKIGQISDEVCSELGIKKCDVIAVAGHDTQSALVSVPNEEENFIFISCGTWSLFGTELEKPLINEKSSKYNITNEGGYGGKASFLKNIIGLWLIQESRRQWIKEGEEFGFSELEKMADSAESFKCFVDPDASEFVPAGNIPERIREYCKRTSQKIPETKGEIVRCINESLALKYRYELEKIEECTERKYENIYMVGGGIQSKLLCQMTADACNCKVTAGPVEATVFGNIVLQLIAQGAIDALEEAKKIVAKSPDIRRYSPQNTSLWNEAYERFKEAKTAYAIRATSEKALYANIMLQKGVVVED